MDKRTIKDTYKSIVEYLEANQDSRVKDILPTIVGMATRKRNRNTYFVSKSDTSKIIGMKCAFFNKWMPLVGDSAVTFGIKKTTPTGLNPMCNPGLKLWTAQQKTAKVKTEELIPKVISGEIQPHQLKELQEAIERDRVNIPATSLGFDTLEQLRENLTRTGNYPVLSSEIS